jgi:hypothetical protein
MEHEVDLDRAKVELYQRIGRNLLMFQKAELLLKDTLKLGNLTLRRDSYHEDLESIRNSFERVTLGQAANRFLECMLGDLCIPDPDETIAFQIKTSFDLGDEHNKQLKNALVRFVEARNYFIHHLILDILPLTSKSIKATADRLDREHEEFTPLLAQLSGFASDLGKGFEFAAGYQSPLSIMGSPLFGKLVSLANNHQRPDGWTSFNTIGKIIKQEEPELIRRELARFDMKSITQFALASKVIETRTEPTEFGGTRAVYRERPPVF